MCSNPEEDSVSYRSGAVARAGQAAPMASDALLALTGISPTAAPGNQGQLLCAFLMGGLRGIPTKVLLRLDIVRGIRRNARVCAERSGDGTLFYRVRYEIPRVDGRRRRGAIYLGTNPVIAEWAAGILAEERWRTSLEAPPTLDHARIAKLRHLRRHVAGAARQVARRAGYSFRGSRLLEMRHA